MPSLAHPIVRTSYPLSFFTGVCANTIWIILHLFVACPAQKPFGDILQKTRHEHFVDDLGKCLWRSDSIVRVKPLFRPLPRHRTRTQLCTLLSSYRTPWTTLTRFGRVLKYNSSDESLPLLHNAYYQSPKQRTMFRSKP